MYDQEKLDEGVFAVVEVMLALETSESMAVANLITYASRFMEDVSVSTTMDSHRLSAHSKQVVVNIVGIPAFLTLNRQHQNLCVIP